MPQNSLFQRRRRERLRWRILAVPVSPLHGANHQLQQRPSATRLTEFTEVDRPTRRQRWWCRLSCRIVLQRNADTTRRHTDCFRSPRAAACDGNAEFVKGLTEAVSQVGTVLADPALERDLEHGDPYLGHECGRPPVDTPALQRISERPCQGGQLHQFALLEFGVAVDGGLAGAREVSTFLEEVARLLKGLGEGVERSGIGGCAVEPTDQQLLQVG